MNEHPLASQVLILWSDKISNRTLNLEFLGRALRISVDIALVQLRALDPKPLQAFMAYCYTYSRMCALGVEPLGSESTKVSMEPTMLASECRTLSVGWLHKLEGYIA